MLRHSVSWMGGGGFDESEEFKDRITVASLNLGRSGGLSADIISVGDPLNCQVNLASFSAWAVSIQWELPRELGNFATDAQRRAMGPQDTLSGKAKTSALILIIAMAMAKYRYDPEKSQNSTVKNIHDDVLKLGMTLSLDTIRNWLSDAAEVTLEHGRDPKAETP